jgi:hypothetical protein
VINPQKDYTIKEINQINAYVGRLNTVLDGTVEAGDLAIFYPIATVQALHNADDVHSSAFGNGTDAVKLNNDYTDFCLDLLQKRVLYAIIDDQSICAATVTADGRLVIGNGSYRTIVLAFGKYISADAAEKLALFKEAGGNVVFVKTTCSDYQAIDQAGEARVSAAMNALADCDHFEVSAAATRISKMQTRFMKLGAMDVLAPKTVFYGEFMDATHDIAYVANSTAKSDKVTLEFTDGYDGAYTVYYPHDGMIVSGSGSSVTIDLPAYCAVLIMREDNNEMDNTPYAPAEPETTQPETTQPETQAPEVESSAQETEGVSEDASQGGCKSAFGALPVMAIAAAGVAVICKKKKK